MKEGELPPGWAWATLGEVAEITLGQSPPGHSYNANGEGLPFFQGKAEFGELYPEVRKYTTDPRKTAKAGDILLSVRAPVGAMNLAPLDCAIGRGLASIRPSEYLNCKYIRHAISGTIKELVGKGAGTTFDAVSGSDVRSHRIPVPPLAEQDRIVDALEDHLSRLDAAVGYLDSSSQRAVQFRRAVVGGIVAGSSQNMTTIGDEFEVFVGATPSRKEPKNWHGDVPWVSSGEVAFTKIMETRERISADAVGNKSTRIHPPGTLLIAMIGEGKTRGQVAILGIEAAHNQNCASIRIDPEKAISEFVYYVLEHRYEESRKASSGGNQPALNKSKVKAIPLPLPDLEVQQRIVDEISLLDSGIKQVRSTAELAAARASRLRDSLLNKAFSGRLVPQDSADEPASALLERIKAERASQPKPTRKRSAKTATASTRPAPATSSDPAGTYVQEELGL